MKNVFFALAFMLVGTFAFANNSVETELNSNEAVEFTNVLELITMKVHLLMKKAVPLRLDIK